MGWTGNLRGGSSKYATLYTTSANFAGSPLNTWLGFTKRPRNCSDDNKGLVYAGWTGSVIRFPLETCVRNGPGSRMVIYRDTVALNVSRKPTAMLG